MIDFNIPSKGLRLEEREVYNLNEKLRKEIENGPFKRDWLLKLNFDYINQLEIDHEHLVIGDYRQKIHPYLRRFLSYGNALNLDLINCLCHLGREYPNLDIGLAIDPEFIQLKDQVYPQIIQLEKEYGIHYDLPKIIKRLLEDRKTIKSFYFRSDHTGLMVLINLLDDDNIIEFNIYEFTLNRANGYFINRSIHANYNINFDYFSHIDGKALLYKEEEYHPLPRIIKKSPKRKLFRVDGDIPNDFFISLSSRFFFENDLILEFFDPDKIENNLLKYLEN